MGAPEEDQIRIGVSACLLGHEVRYDGGHKRDRFVTDTLGRYFEWLAVCPEAEAGFGTPREPMRLQEMAGASHLVTTKSGKDLTPTMQDYARIRLDALAKENLSGYILKSDSPSCGMERVKVYSKAGPPARTGRGLFAEALIQRFPHLPIEEEGRLCNPRIRENWIERVFAYHRLQMLWKSRWTVRGLVSFHTAHKLALLAHVPRAYQNLGRLVARANDIPRLDLRLQYEQEFMQALAVMATKARHTNVLQHMAGYFKKQLESASRQELQGLIEDHRNGLIPLIAPLALIKHYVRLFNVSYLAGQTYLNPHPKELALTQVQG